MFFVFWESVATRGEPFRFVSESWTPSIVLGQGAGARLPSCCVDSSRSEEMCCTDCCRVGKCEPQFVVMVRGVRHVQACTDADIYVLPLLVYPVDRSCGLKRA